eukprot:CAMPEP_0179494354 /NCGR_PEP_ID=MMETSP0799-20121207/68120_1 /TAXON_ID=46947 /ORGANISM="Geminigera cryophila, Strain CCMP2564" /LENGTH=145 /DNA_ID=CAMNT_0021311953 /DNA_START=127 /DNA_END=564 /DNA_ORIENTATION=+
MTLLVLSILCALSHCTARDPDDMGAAFAAGVVSMESFMGAYDTKETEQLEAVVSDWKLFSRSHPNAPRGEHQSLRQRLQGIVGVPSTEQEDMDECDGTAPCTCACFCKGTCLQSQSVPVELALFRRERSAHLQGARVCMCLRDNF